MKKRILAMALTAAMMLSLFPRQCVCFARKPAHGLEQ